MRGKRVNDDPSGVKTRSKILFKFFFEVQIVYNGDSSHKKKNGADFWRYSCGNKVR